MIANRIPRAELEAQSREQYRRLMGIVDGGNGSVPAPEPPKSVNGPEAITVGGTTLFFYDGHAYVLPNISWQDGFRMNEIVECITSPDRKSDDVRAAFAQAVEMMFRLSKPASAARFIPRALRRNPFRNASEMEVVALLDFFWKRRTGQSLADWLSSRRSGASRRN